MKDNRLYDMMDWARIEGLVYSEEDQPFELLGPHLFEDGLLIQAFLPYAASADVVTQDGTHYAMEMEDETGFFAVCLEQTQMIPYTFHVTMQDGRIMDIDDPYRFDPQVITDKDEAKFAAGIWYHAYEKLGAHRMTIDNVPGVYFAVWAPNAVRVSVVGNFNNWDGRALPMRRRTNSGIFELFIPGLGEGDLYKYEIKAKGGLTYLKADPYANATQLRPDNASVVADLSGFSWTDASWIKKREVADAQHEPMAVYEVQLSSWKRPEDGRLFYTYQELAPMLADYVRGMGYTHVELLPVMEYPLDESRGFQTSGYYAPTARHGSPKEFMYLVNYLHSCGIGVILDWVPAHFPADTFSLCGFDGTCLYEHRDPRQGRNEHLNTLLYNYGRPQVKNFLISSALFWSKVYHADGLRLCGVSSMLYLNYGKSDGQWVANMYGGNENLDAIEFIKHLNSIYHKELPGALLCAQEESSWPKLTTALEDEGMGFDFKWNDSWTNDFLGYMQLDPIFRGYHHGDLTLSMIYQYCENYILALSHNDVSGGKGSMLAKMPGRRDLKFANLRACYGFMMTHPGKKLMFMGTEFGQKKEWDVMSQISWDLLKDPQDGHAMLQGYVKDLLEFYRSHPALYAMDNDPDGFEWINSISANENMVVFLRRGTTESDMLLVVCNFSPLVYENHKIGVPFAGKYKEIFNSDKAVYGGEGNVNPRLKNARLDECDGRDYSIRITVPPMGVCVFSCTRTVLQNSSNEKAKEAKAKEEKQARVTEAKAKVKASAKTPKAEGSLKEELERKFTEANES